MDLAKELLGWGAGLGLLGTALAYSITFVTSKSHERRLQRRELQYLYNFLVFIMFVIVFPFAFTLPINEDDYNLVGFLINFGQKHFLFLFIIQLVFSMYILFLNKSLLNRFNSKEIISFVLKLFSFVIFIYTSLFSFIIFREIISTYQNQDLKMEAKISFISFIFFSYLILYIPYYIGFIGMIKTKTLVTIYLNDGKVLKNLLLSHRSFGSYLIFYDSEDETRSRAVTIAKDSIQMIVNVECFREKKIDEYQQYIDEFTSHILIKDSDKEK